MAIDKEFSRKILNMWNQRADVNHNNADQFRKWFAEEHGFTLKAEKAEDDLGYVASYLVIDKIVDEQKFAWFLLQC